MICWPGPSLASCGGEAGRYNKDAVIFTRILQKMGYLRSLCDDELNFRPNYKIYESLSVIVMIVTGFGPMGSINFLSFLPLSYYVFSLCFFAFKDELPRFVILTYWNKE